MLLDFIIVGAQKSATTFLHTCLNEHPDIYIPKGEIAFFQNPDYQENNIHELEGILSSASQGSKVGIKRPSYLGEAECPGNIHTLLPNVKLFVVLRKPVERAISAYYQQMNAGFLPVRSIEKGFSKILANDYKDKYPKSTKIIEYGFYFKHLTRYLKYFDKEQFQITFYDDIKTNTLHIIKQAYQFLNVRDDFVPSSIKSRVHANNYNLVSVFLNSLKNRFVLSYNPIRTRSRFKENLSLSDRIIAKSINTINRNFVPFVKKNDLKYDLVLYKKLYDIYKDDIDKLENLLDRDLSDWKVYNQL